MKLVVFLSILTLIRAEESWGDYTPVYIVNGVRHYKEVLIENLSRLFNYGHHYLPTDYSTNELYIPYFKSETPPIQFNINNKNQIYIFIPGTFSSPQCITIDQVNHDVYMGTDHGIYKYNRFDVEFNMELVGASGIDVWRIYYYNGVIYYTDHSTHTLRWLVNGRSVIFFDFKVTNFVIDNEGNIVFTSINNSLFKYKKATKENILYKGIPDVKHLTTDRNGNVYFSVNTGIYVIKEDGVERIAIINNPTNIAFDNENNLIYYNDDDEKLYRLKPIENAVNVTDTVLKL